MVKQLNTFLSENSTVWGLPAAGAWNFWLYNNSHPHCANLDIMWFHSNDEFPRVVTKLDHKPKALAREFENLAQVHCCAPGYVPKPLSFGLVDDFWALWMEGMPGLPFGTGDAAQSLRQIVEMLVSIHSAVRDGRRRTGAERHRQAVVEPFESVAQFGDSAAVRAGCARLSAEIGEPWVNSLPVIPQHGDFYPGNVILFHGQPRVLDWETYGTIDLPFYDLLTFLISLISPDGAMPARLDPGLAHQLPALVEIYAAGIGLPASDLEYLLPLTLVNWFHLMWLDGRTRFAVRMYRMIEHFFEHPGWWQQAFLPA